VQAVTNISSQQVVRAPASPFANDPFFRRFLGDADDMFGYRNRIQSSLGSGVIVSPDGYVLTNTHVVGDRRAQITITFLDNREMTADVVGLDELTDLALLKVDAQNLPTMPWGDSSQLKDRRVGAGDRQSRTPAEPVRDPRHRVGATQRSLNGQIISAYEDFIQTDAAINPGNSGGALINARGELVGINTAIFSQSGGYQGIGFAVPSNLARRDRGATSSSSARSGAARSDVSTSWR
jgi:S1-C subfamily serine protease